MSNCCICQFTVRNPKDIYSESIGEPPILISDLVLQCTKGTNYVLCSSSTICKKCCEKLSRYHKSIHIAKKLRQEILELIRSPYIIKEFKTVLSQKVRDEGNDLKTDESADEQVLETKNAILTPLELEEVESLDIKDIKTDIDTSPQEEFQVVHLDIENEIVIHEEEEPTEENLKPDIDIDGSDKFAEEIDMLSEFEEINDTIEYIISDAEDQDADSSADFTVNIQCSSCPQNFSSRRQYNAHTKREHFPGYVCDQCGKTLQSYSGFIGHLQNHEPVKQFECPQCGERFNRKFRLKHHMAWHTGETPYQCEICSKSFVHKVALYKHKMIHDNDTKRLECQVCGFKTRTKAHLERHMRSHTGAKPFSCPVCKKCFSQMYNMKAHLREHENPGCNRQRRFHCPKCTHTFINEQNYLTHVERGDCTSV